MSESNDKSLAVAGRRAPQPLEPRAEEVFHSHPGDPFARFAALLELARSNPNHREPTAMSLSTVDADGRPSSRIVLLKGSGARGFTFFTNLDSRKGMALKQNKAVALLFHWQPLEVQVRIEGDAIQVDDAEADAYFAGRPRQSQLGAWASDQSATLDDRDELLCRMEMLQERFGRSGEHPIPRPPNWSGFRVVPRAIEFWRNQESRLHERDLYTRADANAPWTKSLLNP